MGSMRADRFERLYQEHAQPLLAFLVYRTGSRPLAEDILADTFERVLRRRAPFDPRRGSEKTWLYSIAINVLRDQARRGAAETRAVERAVAVAAGETHGGFDAVEERDAVALRYGADLTVPEIAKLTGEKLTTVEGRVYRALRKLRAEIG